MNIIALLIIVLCCSIGFLSSAYLVVSMVAIIGCKIYRKLRYGASLYD